MKRKFIVTFIISIVLFLNTTLPSLATDGFISYDSETLLEEANDSRLDLDNEEPDSGLLESEELDTVQEEKELETDSTEDQELEEDQENEEASIDQIENEISTEEAGPLFDNKTPNVNAYTPEHATHTSQLGSQSVLYIDGVSFSDLDGGIYDYGIQIDIDGDPTVQIDKIVIPPIYTTKEQSTSEIFVMSMGSISLDHAVSPVLFDRTKKDNQPIVVTREDLLAAGKEGECPYFIRIIFGLEGEPYGKTTELIQTAPIEVHYTTIGYDTDPARPYNPVKRPKRYYQYIKYETVYGYQPATEKVTEEKVNYMFFNGLDVTLTADKQNNLKPGDEVKVTFDVKNNSQFIHRYQNLGFSLSGLELVDKDSKFLSSDDGKSYNMKLVGDDRKMLLFQPLGEDIADHVAETTITETFKVIEGNAANPIQITPYTYFDNHDIYRYQNEKNYHSILNFTLAESTTTPETGTPGTGTPGTSTTESGSTEVSTTETTATEAEEQGVVVPGADVENNTEMPDTDENTDGGDNEVEPNTSKPKPVNNSRYKNRPQTGDTSIPIFILVAALIVSSIVLLKFREKKTK